MPPFPEQIVRATLVRYLTAQARAARTQAHAAPVVAIVEVRRIARKLATGVPAKRALPCGGVLCLSDRKELVPLLQVQDPPGAV